MRLDKYLYFIRLTKTRALAQAILAEGHVRIDGAAVSRSNASVAPGKVITLPIHGVVRVIRVEALPIRRGPSSEARLHYSELGDTEPIDARRDAI